MKYAILIVAYSRLPCLAPAQELRVLAWNTEGNGSSPAKIAEQLQQFRDYDILGLTEVERDNFDRYTRAVTAEGGPRRRYIGGLTGRNARLLIIYDSERLTLRSYSELFSHGDFRFTDDGWQNRAPLVCHFLDTATKTEFLFVVNHFARGAVAMRRSQAEGLREWARTQTLPIIAVGDYNFDFDFRTGTGNEAFSAFLQGGVWKWVRPQQLIDTNWADRDGDGRDDFPDSMLDFVFVANGARQWKADVRAVVRDGDFPDDQTTSDHRPVEAVLKLAD